MNQKPRRGDRFVLFRPFGALILRVPNPRLTPWAIDLPRLRRWPIALSSGTCSLTCLPTQARRLDTHFRGNALVMSDYFLELLTEEIPAWMLQPQSGSVMDNPLDRLAFRRQASADHHLRRRVRDDDGGSPDARVGSDRSHIPSRLRFEARALARGRRRHAPPPRDGRAGPHPRQ